ncbi:MAG: TetR/AcrR family transcriptional regulator [Bdellovibrionales bacterium]|nr:TetR/AcrR family transcriptional regulator [Bdellovibrionales bacterium]
MKRKAKPASKSSESYHHGNLRETLIRGALKFLEKNPLESLSLNTLATRAGVSQAAPYRHFKNRNELLAAISQQGFEIKMKYMMESFLKNRSNPKELLHGCAQAYFKMGLLHPQHFKLMLTSTVCPSPEYPELEKTAAMTFALLKKVVEASQKAGVIGPGDPYHKSMHCWAVVNGFTTLYVEGRLDWLGVNDDNAQTALRVFIDQFISGNQSPLPAHSNFKVFSTTEAEGSLERLKMAEVAIEQMIDVIP